LAFAFRKSTCLRVIDIRRNQIGEAGGQELLASFRQNRWVQRICLLKNKLSAKTFDEFLSAQNERDRVGKRWSC
jgi:hypothetical protein